MGPPGQKGDHSFPGFRCEMSVGYLSPQFRHYLHAVSCLGQRNGLKSLETMWLGGLGQGQTRETPELQGVRATEGRELGQRRQMQEVLRIPRGQWGEQGRGLESGPEEGCRWLREGRSQGQGSRKWESGDRKCTCAFF